MVEGAHKPEHQPASLGGVNAVSGGICKGRGGAAMVAEAWWNIVLGGDVVFLLIANVGIQIAEVDMDLLGRKNILLRELLEEFFRAGAAGGDIGHSEMEWVLPSRGG